MKDGDDKPEAGASTAPTSSSATANLPMNSTETSSAKPLVASTNKSKVGKCFVRCLRRLGNVNTNRHVILESGMTCWIGRADDNQVRVKDENHFSTFSRFCAHVFITEFSLSI